MLVTIRIETWAFESIKQIFNRKWSGVRGDLHWEAKKGFITQLVNKGITHKPMRLAMKVNQPLHHVQLLHRSFPVKFRCCLTGLWICHESVIRPRARYIWRNVPCKEPCGIWLESDKFPPAMGSGTQHWEFFVFRRNSSVASGKYWVLDRYDCQVIEDVWTPTPYVRKSKFIW